MAAPRTYADPCGIARTLDHVGERWALLVVRELLLGPKRFTDLRDGLPNASPNVLAQRLRELEQAALVRRRRLPPPASCGVYELTEDGRRLGPTLRTLGAWALRLPSYDRGAPVSPDSVVLGLGTFFDPDAAAELTADYELRLGEHIFRVRLADRQIELERGIPDTPDAIIDTDAETLAAVVWNERELADAVQAHDLTIEGDQRLAGHFFTLFRPPPHGPATVN